MKVKLIEIIVCLAAIIRVCYPISVSVENIPLKPAAKLVIQDGEFLRYGKYKAGEKYADEYIVSRIIEDKNGQTYVKIYIEEIAADGNQKLPVFYMDYSRYLLISVDKASIIESVKSSSTNEVGGSALEAVNNEFFWRYYIGKDKDFIEFESKVWNGYEVKIRKNKVKFKTGFPIWDLKSGVYFAPRFLDTASPGVSYFVVPEILKEPVPVTYKFYAKETLQTKIGQFNAIKLSFLVADPFLGQLMESYTKETFFCLENSERRLILRIQGIGIVNQLEEVSNILVH